MIPDCIKWERGSAFLLEDPYTTTTLHTPEGEFRSLVPWCLPETTVSSSPWTLVYTNERSSPTEWELEKTRSRVAQLAKAFVERKQDVLERASLQRRMRMLERKLLILNKHNERKHG